MKFTLRSASSAALLVGLAGAFPAWAQNTTQPPAGEKPDTDRVVVTGSFIQGTPEDAALPVEVFSQEELEEQGAPTALEFAKSLTIAGPTTGEAYYFSGAALTGSVNYNLRGLGADKTLTLLNGRRGSENTSNIPSAALARTEVLKDGAAVIYGADATGGVVNFITRDDFVGLEAKAQYKYIDGSDGDYGLSLLGGVGEGETNFMWSLEWEHRSRLESEDRDFAMASLDFSVNPAPWSTLTNLAGWLPRGALPAYPWINPASTTAAGEWGNPNAGIISDFTPASCAAVGGHYTNSYTCNYNYIPYYNLVEENDIYRAYAQLNTAVNENMDFHFEASYGQVMSPQVFGSPAQPVIRGPALTTGATYQFYVPITNPYAAAFAASHGAPGSTQGFTPVTYRAFAHGGNPVFGEGNGYGVPSKIDNQVWRVSTSLKGQLGEWAGIAKDVGYDFALTYNQAIAYSDAADIIGFRLQQALNGFGGPNCSGVPDLDPTRFGTQNPALAGKNGCLWWNPFASSFPNQPELGLANPNYVPGAENPIDLARWLFDPRQDESTTSSLTLDLVFNGQSGITLPGGEIGWALGIQGRQIEFRETINSDLYNGNTPCDWPDGTTSANNAPGTGAVNGESNPLPTSSPDFRGCTPDSPGPFVFFGINPPTYNDQQQFSFFGELQVPVLDNLNLQLAARREEFSGGLGATVYKVSGKWDVWGPLSLRASYGTNYQAPPIGVTPGATTNAVRSYTIAGGNWLGAQFVTDSSLVPETAKAWNTGVIWQSQGLAPDHDLRIIVDYFNIKTEDEIGQLADPNQIANLVFNGAGGTITTCDPNVQPLLNRVTFNAGCTVGMGAVGTFASISTVFGNGPGQSTNGIDFQVNYDMPFMAGDLSLGVTATQVLELKTGPTSLDGVVVSTGDDRLGNLNFATVASAAPEWRANFFANYRMDKHNFRLGYNYVSAVTDERAGIQYGETGEEWTTVDLTYLFDITDTLRFTASVNNIADKDPPKAQEELGYDPRLGNPLGRTIEFSIKKTF